MTNRRSSRLNEQLKREISAILTQKVRDPRVGNLLVTDVRVTQDMWMARIFIRALDSDRQVEEILEGLAAAAPFVRKELGKILQIRRIPELRFQHDTTLDSASRIEEVLRDMVIPEEVEEDEDEEGEEG
jgi:ribosome-binding factor A